jgi:hypothetical protein
MRNPWTSWRNAAVTGTAILTMFSTTVAHEAADMMGYGKITFSLDRPAANEGVAVFICEDETRADHLLSKLRADLTWDRLSGIREITLASGVPALLTPDSGVICLVRVDKTVTAMVAPDAATAEARLSTLVHDRARMTFTSAGRHPMSMDFFDLRPVSLYYPPLYTRRLNELFPDRPMPAYSREALDLPGDFWAGFRFGQSYFKPYFGKDELVDGAPHFFPIEFMMAQGRKHDAVVMAHFGDHWAPHWLRLRYPRDFAAFDPHAISGWNSLDAMSGLFLSQQASAPAYSYVRRFTRTTVERLRTAAGDNLGCFRPAGGGHPGDELNFHHLSTEFMGYDPAGQAAFRRWLREVRGLDLAALGERWHGDAARYPSWDEVVIPSHFEFFGGFGDDDTLNLLTGWQWRPDAESAINEGWGAADYRPGDEWQTVDLAPSLRQLFLFGSASDQELRQGDSKTAWFRLEFDADAWRQRQPGARTFLVAQVGDNRQQPVEVHLNDACLGLLRPQTAWCGPVAFETTALLRPGRNVLALKVANGIIRGPVFLTREEPRRYPYLGRTRNARWLDLRDWQAYRLVHGWRREAVPCRHLLPDIPMISASVDKALWGYMLENRRMVGTTTIHHTGGGSSYFPWGAGLGYVIGCYGSSEEGGTIWQPERLSRELAWMLLNAYGHHNYYHNPIDYMRIEREHGWFSANRRLFEIFGKANWERPPIAILRASSSSRHFPYITLADAWDIGRSSLQAAHFHNVYVSEAEVAAGLADDYPVLWDAGSMVMDESLLAAIERYVHAGGTFVATNVTGRHSPLDPDTWPVSRLTGCRVLGERRDMHVTVLPDNPVLPQFGGMTFVGNGLAINWMGLNDLEAAVALEPMDGAAVEVAATWEDGAAAVTMRRLGQGRVVTLGSSFWRSMSDRAGQGVSLNASQQTMFFKDLFAALGVERQFDIESPDVWLRRMTTKNGLQEWFMAYNTGLSKVTGQTLVAPLPQRPARVFDVVTGEPVPFTWQDGQVRISAIEIAPNSLRVFGMPTADPGGIWSRWFAEKRHYESRPKALPPDVEADLPLPEPEAIAFDQFRFRMAQADETGDAWLNEATDTTAWRDLGYGFWSDHGLPPTGVGFYRCQFTPRPSWHGCRVLLSFSSWDYPVFLEEAKVFVNGVEAANYREHGWANFDVHDITALLREGTNELAVQVRSERVNGAYLGQLAAYPLHPLRETRPLPNDWKLFSDNRQFVATNLPVAAAGRKLEIEVTIPADWPENQVVLEFETKGYWLGFVMVNDRPLARNAYTHPYPDIMQINLFPYVRPGQVNRIELWPREPEKTPQRLLQVERVAIGLLGE